MELYEEILAKIFEKEKITILSPKSKINMTEIVEMECCKALQKIKTIIENDSLSDFECVEEIVCVFEEFGSSGGNRHDFG